MFLDILKIFFINLFITLSTLIPQRTLSIGFTGEPVSFLPHQAQNDSEKAVSDMVFRKLFKFEEGELVNDLIEKYSVSDDNAQYTLKLKPDLYWQDRTKITSDDILYTLTLYESLRNELEIEKISDQEILIRLPTPTAILPSLLTFGLEPSHLQNQSQLTPTGSSSYRISRIIREGSKIHGVILQSYEKNKQYNRVTFRFYKNENDLKTAYKLGEIVAFLSDADFSYKNLESESVNFIGRYFTLIFNTQDIKLENTELRVLLRDSLDIETFLSTQNYHANSIKAEGPISFSDPYTSLLFKQSTYKPDVKLSPAQQNLVKELEVLLPNNQDGRQIAPLIKEGWEKSLGISINIQYLELSELLDKAKDGAFEVLFVGHEVTPDPDRYIFWHSTQMRNLNLARFEDLRADAALEEGRRTDNEEDRIGHYSIFQDVINTKTPAVFIYHPGKYFYHSNKYPVPLPKKLYYPSEIIKNL